MESKRSLLHLSLFSLFLALHLLPTFQMRFLSCTDQSAVPFCSKNRANHAACSVDFANMNYTVITSQCKGPNYTPERCCTPLKQLLCPVVDQVNDLKSNCADMFFSYVNLYGKYPPGLFASLCREGEEGLDCIDVPQWDQGNDKNGAIPARGYSSLLIIFSGALLLVFYS